jgi:photosystem II stability/assembly factor-like uncharacterized protein
MNKTATAIFIITAIFIFSQREARAQWEQTNGPYKYGALTSFAIFNNNLYSGSWDGVFRFDSSDTSWQLVSNGLADTVVPFDVNAFDTCDGRLFAGTSNGILYRSTNNGSTWIRVDSTIGSNSINSLATIDGDLFASSLDSLYISTDVGITWKTLINAPTSINVLYVSGNQLYAGTYNGQVVHTSDLGETWVSADSVLNYSINAIIISNGDLLVGTSGGVFVSTDSGAMWSETDSSFSLYISQLFISNGILYAAPIDSCIFRSTDNGASWTALNNGFPSCFTFTFCSSSGNLFAGTDSGVFRSMNNGNNWIAANNGLQGRRTFHIFSLGNTLYAGTDNGIYASTDSGADWIASDSGLPRSIFYRNIYALYTLSDDLFAGTDSGIYILHSGDSIWLSSVTTKENDRFQSFASLGTILFAGSRNEQGIFRSTDNGLDWMTVNNGIQDGEIPALCTSNSNIFAATFHGVFRSSDSGATWINTTPGTYGFKAIVPINNRIIAVSQDSGIYISSDNGANWETANNGLGVDRTAIDAFSVIGDTIFAASGGNGGVFVSTDGGKNWYGFNKGFTHDAMYRIQSLAIYNGYLYAGTYSTGTWRYSLADFNIDAVNENPFASPTLQLAQNYPNPFSTTTNVEFRLPTEARVTLNVYNSLGEEVATVANEKMSAGEHSLPFRAAGLQNGIYFYRLTAGRFSQTGKMTVVH